MQKLTNYFDAVYYINLPHRTDRREEVEGELRRAEMSAWRFEAVRPDGPGGFSTIGARGCFMSHLGALEAALKVRAKRVLILEDDVAFLPVMVREQSKILKILEGTDWAIAYLGHGKPAFGRAGTGYCRQDGQPWSLDRAAEPFAGFTHCLAVNGSAIEPLVEHLQAILAREPGHPDGGPMHVDGAYAHFQAAHPEFTTLIATPEIAEQRASHTDVHAPKLIDRVPILSHSLLLMRRVRNYIRRIHRFGSER